MCQKCLDVKNLLAHSGSEWEFNGEFVTLRGHKFAYFRHVSNSCHEAGVIGFGLPGIEAGWGAIGKQKMAQELEDIAYGD